MRVVVAAVVVLAACGRIGFDGNALSGDAADATDGSTSDAPGAPFMIELPQQSAISDIAILPDGGVVAVGARVGSLTIDGVTDVGVGAIDIVVVALDPDGHVRWLHQYGGTENDAGLCVAVAPDGSIYVGGFVQNNASVGGPIRGGDTTDAFIAKYTPDGDYVWDVRFGGVEDNFDQADSVFDLAVRADGEVFAVGRVAGIVNFGLGDTAASAAVSDAFAARYSPAGQARWAKRYGNADTNAFGGVAVTNDAVYVGGFYSGSPNFGNGALPARGGHDAVMLRIDATSTALDWVSTFGGEDNQRIYNIALRDNAIVGIGYYWETIDLPTITAASQRADGIVAAYNTVDGSFVDAFRYGGPGCDFLYSAHADNGQVVAAGTFQDTVMLDTAVTTAGLSDNITFAVDSDGFQWHRSFGDTTDEIATASAGGLSSALYVGGMRNIQLDTGCNTVNGVTTGYIRRY